MGGIHPLPSLPSQVDCVVVNTTPVKAAIDDQMNRLFDALVNSLRKAITGHMADIDDFVESGTEALNMRPTTLDEIGVVNAKHAELSKRKPAMRPLFEKAEVKNRLLRCVHHARVSAAPRPPHHVLPRCMCCKSFT